MLALPMGLAMATLWASCISSPAEAAGRSPNIVVVLLDNVGQEWFGCYGSEENCTPNIDRLATAGVRFESCYTPTVCGPSRVQLLTGRYPFRTGWFLHHDAALYSGGGFDWKREMTFARVLRDAGYATGIAGKWQVNNLYDEPDALRQHGFDEHLVWPGSIDRDKVSSEFLRVFQRHIAMADADALTVANSKIESRYWDPVLIREGRREVHPGKFGPDLLQAFAVDFIRRHRDKSFLLYYPMVLTHGVHFSQPVVQTPDNRDQPTKSEHELFADMLRYADKQIGELTRALEAAGIMSDTCVFVASDNGTEKSLSARRNGREVRGGLYRINETGGSVALVASAPGRFPGGRTAKLADFTDLFPTICELCHARVPEGLKIDGLSHAAFLRGEAPEPRTWIFNQYLPDRVVRDARFKLYAGGSFFDLAHDPDEQTPSDAAPSTAAGAAKKRLQAALDSFPPDSPLPFQHRSLSAFRLRKLQSAK